VTHLLEAFLSPSFVDDITEISLSLPQPANPPPLHTLLNIINRSAAFFIENGEACEVVGKTKVMGKLLFSFLFLYPKGSPQDFNSASANRNYYLFCLFICQYFGVKMHYCVAKEKTTFESSPSLTTTSAINNIGVQRELIIYNHFHLFEKPPSPKALLEGDGEVSADTIQPQDVQNWMKFD
jgi:hypothetical protein